MFQGPAHQQKHVETVALQQNISKQNVEAGLNNTLPLMIGTQTYT